MVEIRNVESLDPMLVTRTGPDQIRLDLTTEIVLTLDDHAARQMAEHLIWLTRTQDRPSRKRESSENPDA